MRTTINSREIFSVRREVGFPDSHVEVPVEFSAKPPSEVATIAGTEIPELPTEPTADAEEAPA